MKDIIIEAFKKFLKNSSPTLNIEKLDTGLSESQIFKVTLVNTRQDYICKIFPVSYKERIQNSTEVENFLIENNYPIPKTLLLETQFTDQLGLLIQEYVKGETFYHKIISNSVTDEMLKNVAANLATLHSLPLSEVWQNKRIPCHNKLEWISNIKKWSQDLESLLKREDINMDIYKYMAKNTQKLLKLIEDLPLNLCSLHWDYNPQNILLDEDRVKAVLDFEIHRVGDNHAELGIVLYWLKFYDADELIPGFIHYYQNEINNLISTEKIEGYYLLHLLSSYKYLAKKKRETIAYEKVKSLLYKEAEKV